MRPFVYLSVLLLSTLGALAHHGTGEEWPAQQFETGTWTPPYLMVGKLGEVNPGNIFINVRNALEDGGTAPTIYDNDGEMIWQGVQRKTMDFKMQKLFGKDVITYWDGETGVLGYGYGSVHVLDASYKEIYTVTLQDNFVTPDGKKRDTYVDVHEHLITPKGTMIVSAINITQVDTSMRPEGHPGTWIIDCLFYEVDIKTNEILFSWAATENQDILPLGASKFPMWGSGFSQESPWDCYHMNSIQYANHGYVVSIRYYWYALYLHHDGTKRWILSGGNRDEGDIPNDAHFAWQHDIRVYNETDDSMVLTAFNNDVLNEGPPSESTGVAINVDLKNMTGVTFRQANSHFSDPSFARTQGSFQLLDYNTTGHMLMSYGSTCKWKEYNGDGKVVMTGQFGYVGHAQAYRTFKFPWHAIPHYPPTGVAKRISEYTTDVLVYMSWNGCTEHDNWNIYSVPTAHSTIEDGTLLHNHAKKGFETHADLRDPNTKHLIVEALQGTKSLGVSRVVEIPPISQDTETPDDEWKA